MTAKQKDRYLQLNFSYWGAEEGVVTFRNDIVTVRAEHTCYGLSRAQIHKIQPGSEAVAQVALFDGRMGTCYTCLACLDKWAEEINWDA